MKREIKFRALKDDVSNCNFVYGSLAYRKNHEPIIQENDDDVLFTTCLKNTEGQFTGLKDKNGKEIYEGDILKWTSQADNIYYNTVYFCVGTATCGYKIKNRRFHKKLSLNGIFNAKAIIVGNIHENPELIK